MQAHLILVYIHTTEHPPAARQRTATAFASVPITTSNTRTVPFNAASRSLLAAAGTTTATRTRSSAAPMT